ncbi:MAG: leucine-rich repeat domain-containing protein, partial [Oscillospiraceae bacterium]|nr:leucine-rich repeat domain-containing protein [Oscillospiraceae bacterium]
LDVSKNTALTELRCEGNQLTSLKVSGCTALEWLYCDDNQLTSLDVSKNTALTELSCFDNQLTALDVSRNTALKELWCFNNQLTALDVSKNTALNGLYCDNNQLKSLDVSRNTALEWLSCDDNQLTALDVSKNTALTELSCFDNQLTALDVSKNTALEYLVCDNNQLTSLDVSKNTALKWLSCDNNQLTVLDVSKNMALEELDCSNNNLTSLDVSKNTALSLLYCYGNQLTVLDLSAVPKLLDALEKGMKSVRSKDNVVRYVHNGDYDYIFGEELYDEIEMDLNQKTIPASNPFLDVTADDYFNDAVSWAYQNGVASGTSKTKFSPAKTCTREQVVTFLWRAKGCPEPTGTNNPFKDVPADAYYAEAVLWAVEQGITTGKSKTKFGVGSPCTREQVVTFLWRAEGKPEPESTVNPFTDVSEESYAYKAILWAVEKGITKGTSKTKFSPAKTCTRGQVVTFLYRDVVGEQ